MKVPKRHWFRFSLRTMFVAVTLTCVILGIRFGWRPNWIAQRQEFLADQQADWDDLPSGLRKWQNWGPPHVKSRAGYGTKFTLWFFGETTLSQIQVPIMVGNRAIIWSELAENPKVQMAARLFPDASIYAIPLPYVPGLGPRWTSKSDPHRRDP